MQVPTLSANLLFSGESKSSKHPKVFLQGIGEELPAKAEEGSKGKAGEEGGGEDEEEGEEGRL